MEKKIDYFIKTAIQSSASELEELLRINIFSDTDYENRILQKSVFIHIMILLRDLLSKAEKYGKNRVSFSDDIDPFGKVNDITDLVSYVRNAVCHIDSENHKIDTAKITYCVIVGKGNLMKIGDIDISSPYDDDICFVFGRCKIFLVRHIYRAFDEALKSLSDNL